MIAIASSIFPILHREENAKLKDNIGWFRFSFRIYANLNWYDESNEA